MKDMYKKVSLIVIGAAVIAGSFSFGAYVGYESRPEVERVLGVLGKTPEVAPGPDVDFSPFWKAWRVIEDKYVSGDGIDRQGMIWGSIEGLASSLEDPYTVFLPPVEKKAFEDEIRGDFEGVGMEIGMRKGILTVIAPLKNTPAERAGLKAGDKILAIDKETTSEITLDEAVQKIRGPKGTEVIFNVLRNGEDSTREIKVTRDTIQIPLIDTEKRENGVFVIKLYSFSERSPQAFRSALREMFETDADKLLLDLRNNPGGFLEASVEMASWFLPAGKPVVIEDFGKDGERVHRSRGYDIFGGKKVVVLVNGGSASASEILAGALRDHNAAKIAGTKTFGKGSVQELVPITTETSLKVTIARWLTPSRHSISENGLEPDFVIEAPKEEDIEADSQLEKAVEFLINEN